MKYALRWYPYLERQAQKKPLILIVTGIPASGKTRFAKNFCIVNKGVYVDVNTIIKKQKQAKWNALKQTFDISEKNSIKLLEQIIEQYKKKYPQKHLVLDSHLSHYLSSKKVDGCFVVKTTLSKLKRRMQKRKYSAEKIADNLEAAAFDTCYEEAKDKGHRIYLVKT